MPTEISKSMLAERSTNPRLTWNILRDIQQLFDFPFMVNAFKAGTIVAILAGLIGWFMVLRQQSFAGHTIAVVGFPGAAGAVLIGISPSFGYFGFGVAAALLIAIVPNHGGRSRLEESAVTGTIGSFALACGFLFVSLYGGFLGRTNALLFGSFLGITERQVIILFVVAVAALTVLAAIARPLLFATVDADVAAARSVPVRGLSMLYLVLLGLTAAEVGQITGSLLVFALLVLPAAAAQRLTMRPLISVATTVAIALLVIWLSLAAAYYSPYPIGFYVSTIAFCVFATSTTYRNLTDRYHTRTRRNS